MKTACAAMLAAVILGGALPAAAQNQLVTTFVPETQRRWDVAGAIGWRGVNKSDIAPEWNRWYDVGAFSLVAGRYLTPHVKIDVDVSTTSVGDVYSQEQLNLPPPLPFFVTREHEFRRTTLGATLAYQFLENRWVHPFLGVGVEAVRESDHLEQQILPRGAPIVPQFSSEERVVHSARPFVTGGAKFYVSERAFVRTDVLFTMASSSPESAVWRIGAGVDF